MMYKTHANDEREYKTDSIVFRDVLIYRIVFAYKFRK